MKDNFRLTASITLNCGSLIDYLPEEDRNAFVERLYELGMTQGEAQWIGVRTGSKS